jgi:hypothetical protein
MTDFSNYTSGKILTKEKLALYLLKFNTIQITGNSIVKRLSKPIQSFEPNRIDID